MIQGIILENMFNEDYLLEQGDTISKDEAEEYVKVLEKFFPYLFKGTYYSIIEALFTGGVRDSRVAQATKKYLTARKLDIKVQVGTGPGIWFTFPGSPLSTPAPTPNVIIAPIIKLMRLLKSPPKLTVSNKHIDLGESKIVMAYPGVLRKIRDISFDDIALLNTLVGTHWYTTLFRSKFRTLKQNILASFIIMMVFSIISVFRAANYKLTRDLLVKSNLNEDVAEAMEKLREFKVRKTDVTLIVKAQLLVYKYSLKLSDIVGNILGAGKLTPQKLRDLTSDEDGKLYHIARKIDKAIYELLTSLYPKI